MVFFNWIFLQNLFQSFQIVLEELESAPLWRQSIVCFVLGMNFHDFFLLKRRLIGLSSMSVVYKQFSVFQIMCDYFG